MSHKWKTINKGTCHGYKSTISTLIVLSPCNMTTWRMFMNVCLSYFPIEWPCNIGKPATLTTRVWPPKISLKMYICGYFLQNCTHQSLKILSPILQKCRGKGSQNAIMTVTFEGRNEQTPPEISCCLVRFKFFENAKFNPSCVCHHSSWKRLVILSFLTNTDLCSVITGRKLLEKLMSWKI